MGSLRKTLEGRSEAHVGFRMRTKFGSHLEKSLSARFPLVVDNNRRYVSRLTTRKKATRQAVCCELGFLIRADWEMLAGSHPDSHITDICPRRRVLGESGHEARFLLVTPDRVAIPYSQ